MQDLLNELLTVPTTPKVTLQIPASADAKLRSLTLRHMLERITGSLRDWDMTPGEAAAIVKRAGEAAEDPGLAMARHGTAAVYVATDHTKAALWPVPIFERATVGVEFHLSDIVGLVEPSHCYVLTVSRGGAALYRADATSLEPLDLPDIPADLAAATEHFDLERQLQSHQSASAGRGGGAAIYHGHGIGEGRDIEEVRNYLRAIDHAVHAAVAAAPGPVALVGPDEMPSEYRAVTRLEVVADRVARKNPEAVSAQELRGIADDVLSDVRSAQVHSIREHVEDLQGSGKASYALTEVVPAAVEGRVDALLIGPHQRWGHYEAATGSLVLAREGTGEDLVNRAAVATLRHRGRVFADPSLPATTAVAASFRY